MTSPSIPTLAPVASVYFVITRIGRLLLNIFNSNIPHSTFSRRELPTPSLPQTISPLSPCPAPKATPKFLTRTYRNVLYHIRVTLTLCIPAIYRRRFGHLISSNTQDLPLYRRPEWEDTFPKIEREWRLVVNISSGVFLTSVMGVFQVIPTINSSFFSSIMVSTIILVIASLFCSMMYVGYRDTLLTNFRPDWQNNIVDDFDHWMFLSLPIVLFTWSILFSILAVLLVAANSMGGCPSSSSTSGGNAGMTLLISGSIVTTTFGVSVNVIHWAFNKICDLKQRVFRNAMVVPGIRLQYYNE